MNLRFKLTGRASASWTLGEGQSPSGNGFPSLAKPPYEWHSAPGAPGQLWKPSPAGTISLRLEFPAGATCWLYLPLTKRKLLSRAGGRGGSQDEWHPQQPMARRALSEAFRVANGQGRGRGVGSRARSRGWTGPLPWGRDRAAIERRGAPAGGRARARRRCVRAGAGGWVPGLGAGRRGGTVRGLAGSAAR